MSTKQFERNERQAERKLNTRLLPVFVALFAILYAWTGYRGWLVLLIGVGGAWLLPHRGGTTLPRRRTRLWPIRALSPEVSALSWNLFSLRIC